MKKHISVIFALILCFSLALPVLALGSEQVPETATDEEIIVMRAEQTMWYYRVTNGAREKRLWSLTYGKWLTDWMPYETPWP